jgi:flavodoxin
MTQITELTREETLSLIAANPKDYFESFYEALEIEDNWDDFVNRFEDYEEGATEVNGFTLTVVYEEGGGEGGGEYCERVFALIEKSEEESDNPTELAHIRIVGYYISHDGTHWEEEPVVVKPREVMVTKYFAEGEEPEDNEDEDEGDDVEIDDGE